jgi:hypothetical protein
VSVDEAKSVLSKLEASLVTATNRATDLQTERRKISFLAFNDNKEARASLDRMNTEFVTAGLECENLRSALDEAKAHVAACERSAAFAKQRENARKAADILKITSQRGPKMAEALRVLCTEISEFLDDMRGLDAYGAPITNIRLAELWIQRAVLPHLRNVGFDVEIIAPGMRGDLAKIGDIYLQNASRWVAETLDVDVAASAEREVA